MLKPLVSGSHGLGRLPVYLWAAPGVLFFLVFLSGCGKPPTLVQRYILEYPSPLTAGRAKVPEAIKVERFSVAQAFNSEAMVFRPNPYKSDVYTYHRWRVNPGNMVSDYLVRDLRDSGLFKAVFSSSQSGTARFQLEGGVEEFQEIDEPAGWKAALVLNVTLLEVTEEEIPQRVVFQKTYRAQEPLTEQTPGGLARGMSQAMEKLSAQIISDVYQAVSKRQGSKGKTLR